MRTVGLSGMCPIIHRSLARFFIFKRGAPLCRKSWWKSWLKSWLRSAWNKHGYFNTTGSSTPIFVIEIVIEFFRTSSARYENSDWNRQKINNRTNTAIFYVNGSTVQKIGRAAQTDFFREVGGAYEYLCRARAVHSVITSTCSLPRRS